MTRGLTKTILGLLLFGLAVSVGFGLAQEPPASGAQSQPQAGARSANARARRAAQARGPLMPQPSPQMKRLALSLAGRWSVTAKEEPFDPAAGGDTGTGFEMIRRGPGGQSMISDLRMKFEKSGRFVGHGVLYWDATANAYKGIWCESVSPVCEDAGTGHWEGDTLVFDGEVAMNGQKVQTRQSYSAITRQTFTWAMEMKTSDGMKPMLTFNYKRAPMGEALRPDVEEKNQTSGPTPKPKN